MTQAPSIKEALEIVENLIRRDPACFNLSDELQPVRTALRDALSHQPAPVAANASAEARWRSLSEDTSWIDGRDVVLLARDMEVQARYCPGEWSGETPNSPREYSGAVWSCFDDEFQLEIEECSHDPSEWGHDGATHWRPVDALSHQPAPAAVNASEAELARQDIQRLNEQDKTISAWENAHLIDASAEARLRVTTSDGFIVETRPDGRITKIIGKVDAHPHTSDCDKQETTKSEGHDNLAYVKISGPAVDALENRKECDNGPSEEQVNADLRRFLDLSDRTADVTVGDLSQFLRDADRETGQCDDDDTSAGYMDLARALLDAFTIGKRLSDKQGER